MNFSMNNVCLHLNMVTKKEWRNSQRKSLRITFQLITTSSFTKNENKELPRILGQRLFAQKKFASAYVYFNDNLITLQQNFLRCRDVEYVVKSMNEVMKNGYESEKDLFIARAQLDFIARSD